MLTASSPAGSRRTVQWPDLTGSILPLPTKASVSPLSAGILGIDLTDVMAFGDNYNDVSMLDIVGHPYIMDGAAAPLREKYPDHTPRPEDILREILNGYS